jgi:hypothetical protein
MSAALLPTKTGVFNGNASGTAFSAVPMIPITDDDTPSTARALLSASTTDTPCEKSPGIIPFPFFC